jgi:3-oxoacyl-[acyl-carrier-protein] synthase III
MRSSKPLLLVIASAFESLAEYNEFGNRPHATVLTESQRNRLRQLSGVRMSKKHSFASILAITAAKNCLAKASLSPSRLGVIAACGPVHLQVAFEMTRQILSEGSDYLDPLLFPHSIPSAVPTSVAAACRASAFAIGIGDNCEAFFEGIEQATRFIAADYADAVLVVATNDSQGLVKSAVWATRGKQAVDAGVCALVTKHEPWCDSLELVQCLQEKMSDYRCKPTISNSACSFDETEFNDQNDPCAATAAVRLHQVAMKKSVVDSWGYLQPFSINMRTATRQFQMILNWRIEDMP